jgi:hypothetical protein
VSNAVICSRVRELREALSAGTIALEIPSRNSRVAALQTLGPPARRPRPDPQPAEGRNGRFAGRRQQAAHRDYKGKEADRVVTRSAPGVVSLVAELRGHERQAAYCPRATRATTRTSRSTTSISRSSPSYAPTSGRPAAGGE